jgi:hypothetical protein
MYTYQKYRVRSFKDMLCLELTSEITDNCYTVSLQNMKTGFDFTQSRHVVFKLTSTHYHARQTVAPFQKTCDVR